MLCVYKRGISYQIESTLDMRMDLTKGSALVEWINSADFHEIYRVIKNYGEEPKAKIITKTRLLNYQGYHMRNSL